MSREYTVSVLELVLVHLREAVPFTDMVDYSFEQVEGYGFLQEVTRSIILHLMRD